MRACIIQVGTVFGKLTVVESGLIQTRGFRKDRVSRCLCQCGTETTPLDHNLVRGATKSCGMCRTGVILEKHRGAYRSWGKMKDRCLNSKHEAYRHYGGKGVTICEKWLEFSGFLEDMGDRPDGLTLDRIDNTLGYFKENCRWMSPADQNNNKTNCVLLTIDGVTHNVTQWSVESGVDRFVIYSRVANGWDHRLAVWSPPRSKATKSEWRCGHAKTPETIGVTKNGRMFCAECNRQRARMNYSKRKVSNPAFSEME